MNNLINPQLLAMNKRTNDAIDGMLASASNQPVVMRRMIDEVLRPYVLLLNSAQMHNANTTVVFDALISVMTAMGTEFVKKTVDPRQPQVLMGAIQAVIDDFFESFKSACEVNFDLTIELHAPAQQAAPGTA